MSRSDVESKLGLNRGAAPGFKRLRLTVAYCGTPWRGWQSQEGGHTVQDVLEAAILKFAGIPLRIHGSGRTDAGVHALGQVAHFDVPEAMRRTDAAWMSALNAYLPLTVRITNLGEVDPGFHARFDAVGKVYRYRIWRPRLLSPFESDRAWHVYGRLDMEALRDCAQMLVGTHNFVRLSANRGDMPETERRLLPEKTTRTIHRVEVRETDEFLELEFAGDGFLYKMVRLIAGSLIQVARGRATREWFADLLATSEGLQSHQTAPACGLYLVSVTYAAADGHGASAES
jgi:tRNA pseudouridine38-40 synthase